MAAAPYNLGDKVKLCFFCIVEISLDTLIFAIFVGITALLHWGISEVLKYFGLGEDVAIHWLVKIGTIGLIIAGIGIVGLFASKSVHEAWNQTWK